jgi:hypothetical protein
LIKIQFPILPRDSGSSFLVQLYEVLSTFVLPVCLTDTNIICKINK